jgi:hypothetical protein
VVRAKVVLPENQIVANAEYALSVIHTLARPGWTVVLQRESLNCGTCMAGQQQGGNIFDAAA